jgi:hypothetical protein
MERNLPLPPNGEARGQGTGTPMINRCLESKNMPFKHAMNTRWRWWWLWLWQGVVIVEVVVVVVVLLLIVVSVVV